jgi:dipeptidase E
VFNDTPVIGLREGSWLRVKDDAIVVKGPHTARLFRFGSSPVEIATGTDLLDIIKIKA